MQWGGGVVPVISAVCECVCVQSPAPGPSSPKHHTAPAPHSCTGGPAGLHGRGSIHAQWGPTHTKSGGTEQEGEGAHFSPPGHRSSSENFI